MEPIAAQSGRTSMDRPQLSLHSDLTAVMREGRLHAGEVLGRLDGSTVLVRIGGNKVPAEAQVDLNPGEKYWFRVMREGDRLLLRVVQTTPSTSEPHLLAALRQLIAKDVPMSGLLSDLGRELVARLEQPANAEALKGLRELLDMARGNTSGLADLASLSAQLESLGQELRAGNTTLARWLANGDGSQPLRVLLQAFVAKHGEAQGLRMLESLLGLTAQQDLSGIAKLKGLLSAFTQYRFEPGAGPAALRALLAQSGWSSGSALLAAAQARGVDSFARALDRWLGALGLQAAPDGKPFSPGSVQRTLLAALKGLAPEIPRQGLSSAELAKLQTAVLERTRGALGEPAAPLTEEAVAQREQVAAFRRVLMNLEEGRHAVAQKLLGAAWQALERGFDGQLLDALAQARESELKTLMARTFSALEIERLMNLARHDSGEGLQWSFPVPDSNGTTNVSLAIREERDSRKEGGDQATESGFRISVGVNFSRLGPLRAELVLRDDHLAVRLNVASEETATRLRSQLAALQGELCVDERKVMIGVFVAAAADCQVDPVDHDIRYLREHPLMDVEG